MATKKDSWDIRCMSISFLIPLAGTFIQNRVESYYNDIHKYIVLILIIIFLAIIPILTRAYFNETEDKMIKELKKNPGWYTILGITSFSIRIGYIVVYSNNILS